MIQEIVCLDILLARGILNRIIEKGYDYLHIIGDTLT